MKYKLTIKSFPRKQQGVTLLAALLVISLLVLIGFRVAEQGKDNTSITGANVRYNQVFEAGEQTIRNAMFFIQSIRYGEPIATEDPSKNYKSTKADTFTNFNVDKISNLMSTSPEYSFVWKGGALEKKVCGLESGKNISKCPSGVDFYKYLENNKEGEVDIWTNHAIKSSFSDAASIDSDNYLSNIRTYTFIEKVEGGNIGTKGGTGGNASEFEGGANSTQSHFYRITVKASGYPPGTDEKNMISTNARENVILQAVYAQLY